MVLPHDSESLHLLHLLKEVGRYTKSSMGWHPPSKKQELFHRDSRFVLLRRSQDPAGLEHPHDEELPILAYSMFRFDMEGDECVLYWYARLSMSFLTPHGALIHCAATSSRSRNSRNEVVWVRF